MENNFTVRASNERPTLQDRLEQWTSVGTFHSVDPAIGTVTTTTRGCNQLLGTDQYWKRKLQSLTQARPAFQDVRIKPQFEFQSALCKQDTFY